MGQGQEEAPGGARGRRGRFAVRGVLAAVVAGAVLSSGPVEAQEGDVPMPTEPVGVTLSLEEAIARATEESEEVGLARSRVSLADAQVGAARSQALPQISGSMGYTKTLASAFDTGGSFTLPDSMRFEPDPSLPLADRVRYLEQRVPMAAFSGLAESFSSLPFGQENALSAQVSGSQLLYAGGRVGAALEIAGDYRDAARLTLAEEVAEIELQVRSAYFQALLAQEMEKIAEAGLAQAEEFLAAERLRLEAGQASELEVLRAEVSRDNLRPQLVQARNAASVAMLNLKRLVDLPLDAPLVLTTALEAPAGPLGADRVDPAILARERAAVLAAEKQVEIQEQQVRIAKSAYLPTVSLSMNYGKQAFPTDPFDLQTDWRTDWSAGIQVQVPIFNGGRRAAELGQARVALEQSRLQLSQLQESVQLQYEQAWGERERARETIAAREATVAQAQRVYDLTVLRYEEGLATQLEVSQSRLELLQAMTNRAQAIADYHLADAGLARAQVAASVAGAD